MSLLSPDHIRLGLGNSYTVLAKIKGNKLTHWRMQTWPLTVDVTTTTNGWQRGIEAVTSWLAEFNVRSSQVSVFLSAELGLLHLLPWRDDAVDPSSQAIIANNYFSRVHSNFSQQWKTVVEPTGFEQPWIASSVSNDLLQSFNQILNNASCNLHSVEPLCLSIYNEVRRQLGKTACWLIVPETRKLNAMHLRDGHIQLLCSLPAESLQHESMTSLLLRETRLAGLPDIPTSIFIVTANKVNDTVKDTSIMLQIGWKPVSSIPLTNPFHLIGVPS